MKHSFLLLFLLAACAPETPESPPTPQPPPSVIYDTSNFEELMLVDPPEDSPAIALLVDEMLGEALADVPADADPRTVALHLNWFAHAHLFNANPRPGYTMLRSLEQRSSICGGSSLVLQLLARRAGIPTRTGAFYGVPLWGGHVVTELFWNDSWHFLDPTFGTFFTADGTPGGEIVSLHTLLKYQHQIAPNAYYAISEGRLGWDYTAPKPETLTAMYAKEQQTLLAGGNYRLFLAGTHAAAAFDTGERMTFPFAADLSAQSTVRIGDEDGTDRDIVFHVSSGPGLNFDATALQFIGNVGGITGPLIVDHAYTVNGLEAGDQVEWRALLLEGGVPESFQFAVRNGTLENIAIDGQLIRVTMRALRDRVGLIVSTTDALRSDFDYIAMKRN